MVDIASLKRNRGVNFDALKSNIAEEYTPKTYDDTRFWKPEVDKLGNATAVIRFLYQTEGDDLPYVKYLAYSFKGPTGKFYIENSLVTFKKPDPVYELNGRLFKSGNETDKLIARNQRLNTKYISNILMVNDPKHPENNGKVFLFRYGPQIHKMIVAKISPEFEDETPVPIFDYWDGANFKLRLKNGEKVGDRAMPTYISSTWDTPAPIGTDEYIQEIAEKQYALSEFLSDKYFKTYDELKKRLDYVYDRDNSNVGTASDYVNKANTLKEPPIKTSSAPVEETEEDYEEYFNKLLTDS